RRRRSRRGRAGPRRPPPPTARWRAATARPRRAPAAPWSCALLGLARAAHDRALVAGQDLLAQAQARRRDLDPLVLVDPLERALERDLARRAEHRLLVGARGAEVRELLGLDRVDVEVVLLRVLAHDH